VRHRNQFGAGLDGLGEGDGEVIVRAGAAVRRVPQDFAGVAVLVGGVDGDEPALVPRDALDGHAVAGGRRLVGERHGRRLGGVGGCGRDDRCAAGGVGAVVGALAAQEVVGLVAVGVAVGHRHERRVGLEFAVEGDRDVLVGARREVLAGAAHALEDRALGDGAVVDGDEPAVRERDGVDGDGRAIGLLVADGDTGGDQRGRRVDDRAAVSDERAVLAALALDERVVAVVVRVGVGHRREDLGLVRGRVQCHGDVLVEAGVKALADAEHAPERVTRAEARVVDRDEPRLGEVHAVDGDGAAVGRLGVVVECHADRRLPGVDDGLTVGRVRAVGAALALHERVRLVVVRVAVGHRDERVGLVQRRVQGHRDVPVQARFEVAAGAADALEDGALRDGGVVDSDEATLGHEH